MAKKRIVVICNKQWEADPVLTVLREPRACPTEFKFDRRSIWQRPDPPRKLHPRCIIHFSKADAEIWCLEDWLPSGKGSSSAAKMAVLPTLFRWTPTGARADAPDLVLALGTAASVGDISMNGSVVVGTQAFVYDAAQGHGDVTDPLFGQLLQWPAKVGVPGLDGLRFQAEAQFILPPMYSAEKPILTCANNYTAVSDANVPSYDAYVWADRDAIAAFRHADPNSPIGSVETTHGLIRIKAGAAPFMFISGIANRVGRYGLETGLRVYAQDFVAAHNAGVALAWLLPAYAAAISPPPPVP